MNVDDLPIPDDLTLDACDVNRIGETNTVCQVKGKYRGEPLDAYLKLRKNSSRHLANEYTVLLALESSEIPAPRVIWASEQRDVLLLEALAGTMLWNIIDPRRSHYDGQNGLAALQQYGELLGRIHGLALEWSPQPRAHLSGLIGEECVTDTRFQAPIDWLRFHEVAQRDIVFTHGDYNTANVLLRDGVVSGIVDWEFAGNGWKEYELAWALRARRTFLNTQPERDALLTGYGRHNHFDPAALRWCEVLNYLHDAYWSIEINPAGTDFSLAQALKLID